MTERKPYSKYLAGELLQTDQGMVEVLKNYGGKTSRLIVRFIDTGYTTECFTGNIPHKIKNQRLPSVYGVGYLDGVRIQPRGSEQRRIYDLWANMLRRVYYHPDKYYADVTVEASWHSFRTFLNTFIEIPNYEALLRGEDVCLDKDLRAPESRIYSLNTCQFIPANENVAAGQVKRWERVRQAKLNTINHNQGEFNA